MTIVENHIACKAIVRTTENNYGKSEVTVLLPRVQEPSLPGVRFSFFWGEGAGGVMDFDILTGSFDKFRFSDTPIPTFQ